MKRTGHADVVLVQKARRKEPAAVEAFLERLKCVPRMLAFKNSQLGSPLNRIELEDVSQDILLAVWRKLDQYTGQGNLESWVYRFCFLELMARIRSLGRQQRLLRDAALDAPAAGRPPPDPVRYEEMYRCLNALGNPVADVIRLKHFEELTFEEIAERLQVSTNTAKTRYYRALPQLRQLLRKEQGQQQGGAR